MTFNDARFNQDGSCICVANDRGFKILNSDPMVETCNRDLRSKNVGSVGLAEMLYRSNLLALVGNSEYYDIRKNSFTNLHNKFIKPWKQNILTIWDDRKSMEVAQLVFNDLIVNVKMLYELLVVVLSRKIYVYQMSNITLVDCSNTSHNSNGLCSVASFRDLNIIAFLGKLRGTCVVQIYTVRAEGVRVGGSVHSHGDSDSFESICTDLFEFEDVLDCGERAGSYVKVTLDLHLHRSEISSIDLSPNGLLLVTSSFEGRFIKLFDTLSGELIQVFRKTTNFGRVTKCRMDKEMKWLAVITDRPKLYFFRIDQEALKECEFSNQNRILQFKNSCVYDVNNCETQLGRYFREQKYSIANPRPRCGDSLCKNLVNKTRLFIQSTHHTASFKPPLRDRIVDCSFSVENETVVVILQGGKALKLFFNPAKSTTLKTTFYHYL